MSAQVGGSSPQTGAHAVVADADRSGATPRCAAARAPRRRSRGQRLVDGRRLRRRLGRRHRPPQLRARRRLSLGRSRRLGGVRQPGRRRAHRARSRAARPRRPRRRLVDAGERLVEQLRRGEPARRLLDRRRARSARRASSHRCRGSVARSPARATRATRRSGCSCRRCARSRAAGRRRASARPPSRSYSWLPRSKSARASCETSCCVHV